MTALDREPPRYDRAVLVNVLIYHYRDGIRGCGCGWAKLGASWPEHVASVYEEAVMAKRGDGLAGRSVGT